MQMKAYLPTIVVLICALINLIMFIVISDPLNGIFAAIMLVLALVTKRLNEATLRSIAMRKAIEREWE